MPICGHQCFEFGEACDVAHTLIFDMHLDVALFRKREQIVNGLSQVIQAVVVVDQITKDAEVARPIYISTVRSAEIRDPPGARTGRIWRY